MPKRIVLLQRCDYSVKDARINNCKNNNLKYRFCYCCNLPLSPAFKCFCLEHVYNHEVHDKKATMEVSM